MPWFGVRTVCWWGHKDDGTNVFEERVVVFQGADWKEVHAKAVAESAEYGSRKSSGFDHDMIVHPALEGYELDGDALIDGYEVWSEMFEARCDLEEFYRQRYEAFDYEPEVGVGDVGED